MIFLKIFFQKTFFPFQKSLLFMTSLHSLFLKKNYVAPFIPIFGKPYPPIKKERVGNYAHTQDLFPNSTRFESKFGTPFCDNKKSSMKACLR